MPERVLRGLAASPGVALGPASLFAAVEADPPRRAVGSPTEELDRLRGARRQAVAGLDRLVSRGDERLTDEDLAIFQAHRLIVEDPELSGRVEQGVADGMSAEEAWAAAIGDYAGVIEALDNETLRERATDVRDVGRRVLRILTGAPAGAEPPAEASILVADDLMPSDTIELDARLVLGFATQKGGPTSHATILARRLGVPAVVGIGAELAAIEDGAALILDGTAGTLIVDAEPETVRGAVERRDRWLGARATAAQAATSGPARTRDGVVIEVAANAAGVDDARRAAETGADGIGLLRTEFLYMGRDAPPGEEELTEAFRSIFEAIGDRLVVARTLDVGGDKPLPYLRRGAEANPFLGVRGIRLSRQAPELLETQIRALLRAAAGARLAVMFPMISTVEEAVWSRRRVEEELERLPPAQRPAELQVGIMVEVPSAALLADRLGPVVDFFSVGTNDLTQYTFAADRTNSDVAGIGDALDPAVLRLIEMVVAAGRAHDAWVGVCGEVASDLDAVPVLVGLGVTELSVHPVAVPEVKLEVTRWDGSAAADLAARALASAGGDDIRVLVRGER